MTPKIIGRKATPDHPLRIAILISGTGSNMEAIIREAQMGALPVEVAVVISDRPHAKGLETAEKMGVQTIGDIASFTEGADDAVRAAEAETYHRRLVDCLEEADVEFVVLAGYMRILPRWVVDRFQWRIVNIHPSLLPSFPGLFPHRQAIEHGVKVSGCTVHLVDYGVDDGPIIAQEAVAVHDDDDEQTLAARVLGVEHRLYPRALKMLTTGRLQLRGRRCQWASPQRME